MKTLFFLFLSLSIVATAPSKLIANRFLSKDALNYGVKDFRRGKVISLPKSAKLPNAIQSFLSYAPIPPSSENGQTWHDYYSSLEWVLGASMEISLRSLAKSQSIWKTDITKGKNIHIVFFHDPFAQAGISEISNDIIIFINDGLVNLIENAAASLELEFARLSGNKITGIGFSEWLELLRTPRKNNQSKNFIVGPDNNNTDPKKFWGPTWYWTTRKKAGLLYQFIFGHELSHIIRGDRVDDMSSNLFEKEVACDIMSFNSYEINSDQDDAFFSILAFLMAMSYHESYWADEIEEAGLQFKGNIHKEDYTRNWKSRLKQIAKTWENMGNDDNKKSKLALLQTLENMLFDLRVPMPSSAIDSSAENDFRQQLVKVKYNREPGDTTVEYLIEMANLSDTDELSISVEVQSRYFSRNADFSIISDQTPKDHKGRQYAVWRDNVHSAKLKPKETKLVYGKLEWFGNKAVYPGIASRLIELHYVY